MSASVAVLVLGALAVAGAQGRQRAGSADEEPTYPYRVLVQDVVWGHLMEGRFKEPMGVAFDQEAGELYVADSKNALIGIYDAEGIPLFTFGGRGLLVDPRLIQVEPAGRILVLDADTSHVKAFSYRGEPLDPVVFPVPGGEEPLRRIATFALGPEGGWIVADGERPRILVYDAALELRFQLPRPDDVGRLERPMAVAVAENGLIAVLDYESTPVQVFDRTGRFVSGFGERDIALEDFSTPVAAAFDDEGYLYVVDMLRHNVKIFDLEGRFQGVFGGWFGPETAGRGPGEMLYPNGIALAPDGRIFVSERFGNRVQIFERRSLDDLPPELRDR